MNITLDTNCIVALETKEAITKDMKNIIAAHNAGKVTVNIPAVGASERLKDGTFADNYSLFQQRVAKLAQREFEILIPPFYIGISYLGWGVLADGPLEEQIHSILFPNTSFMWSDEAQAHELDPEKASEDADSVFINWRNHKCDVLVLWCHIHYGKDILVTNDRNFHKATKKPQLEQLGAKRILYPHEVKV